MPAENNNPEIWKYYKQGDIVKDYTGSIWKETKFEITYFHGNRYCPLILVNICGKYRKDGRLLQCNLDVRGTRLISAKRRPFLNLKKAILLKMMAKGNVEARREFMIRVNTKTL